jgi:hypothetical protein
MVVSSKGCSLDLFRFGMKGLVPKQTLMPCGFLDLQRLRVPSFWRWIPCLPSLDDDDDLMWMYVLCGRAQETGPDCFAGGCPSTVLTYLRNSLVLEYHMP